MRIEPSFEKNERTEEKKKCGKKALYNTLFLRQVGLIQFFCGGIIFFSGIPIFWAENAEEIFKECSEFTADFRGFFWGKFSREHVPRSLEE